MVAQVPDEHITPISTILIAHDDFMKEATVDGKVEKRAGQCVEDCQDKLYYRKPVEILLREHAMDIGGRCQRRIMDEGTSAKRRGEGLAAALLRNRGGMPWDITACYPTSVVLGQSVVTIKQVCDVL
jgi:hypothetical protein